MSLSAEEAACVHEPTGAEIRLGSAEALQTSQAAVTRQLEVSVADLGALLDKAAEGGSEASGRTEASGRASTDGAATGASSTTASSSLSTSTSTEPPLNTSFLLGEMARIEQTHERHLRELLPRARQLDEGLREAEMDAHHARAEHGAALLLRLRAISALQAQIADLRSKLHLYSSLLGRVTHYCEGLGLMRKLPSSYEAALREVILRRRFGISYSAQARDAAEALASARAAELVRREAFMAEHGALLPRNLKVFSALLQSRPPYIEVNSRGAAEEAESALMELSEVLLFFEFAGTHPFPHMSHLASPICQK